MFRTTVIAAAVGAAVCAPACGSSGATVLPQQGPAPAQCGVDLASPTVQAAVAGLPPEPVTQAHWATDPATFRGNFDPCATLSTAIVTIEGATGSSPEHALLFHQGRYVGTATPEAHGFTTLAAEATTDGTVVLGYKTPGSCNACPDAGHTQVGFHWDGRRVVMQGTPPA
ncbi:LppP/LprE family lipoprotein [Nocardia sp. BMG51109]|uniref:LppP/LprE family lipoprotein n=1 Tax=Nocardia sp. BMG51109 TaxID=1056816 RepID=UPI00046326D2|nr:LppP/LprE family lipoprotein [Nocardia sp. BMG51109]